MDSPPPLALKLFPCKIRQSGLQLVQSQSASELEASLVRLSGPCLVQKHTPILRSGALRVEQWKNALMVSDPFRKE